MNGFLLVDKPINWTSFDVVAKVRGILRDLQTQDGLRASQLETAQGASEESAEPYKSTVRGSPQLGNTAMSQKHERATGFASGQAHVMRRPKIKVGHTGTLDPLATGLLIIVIGTYCKRAQEFSKLDKVYEVTMKLGETSTTGDEEGKKIKVSTKQPKKEAVGAALTSFTGEIMQTPPIYSAIKVDGKRAYELARAGKEVKLEPRKVQVYSTQLTDYSYPLVKFTAKVSSGTYIRSLVDDIGKQLGTGAYMSALCRTEVGAMLLKNGVTLDTLENGLEKKLQR